MTVRPTRAFVAGRRRVARSAVVRAARRSRWGEQLEIARRRRSVHRRAAGGAGDFASLSTFCLVVGHTKSGSSILGGILDAHQDVIMADELDVMKYVDAGFDSGELLHLIAQAAEREAAMGRVTARRLTPYSFEIEGQWQGRYRTPRVIGDTKGGIAVQRLGRDPRSLDRLRETIAPIPVKLIQVVRNPLDPIAAMCLRSGRSLSDASDRYFANCEILSDLHREQQDDVVMVVHYEDMVTVPRTTITAVARFLGFETGGAYLDACTSIIRPDSSRERTRVVWDPTLLQSIATRARAHTFLARYVADLSTGDDQVGGS